MEELQQNALEMADETIAEENELDLTELFYRLVEKWKLIVLTAVVGAVVMGIYSFMIADPVYEATSKLYVFNASDSVVNLSDFQIGTYLTADYQQVFETWEVHEMVMQNLGLNYTYAQMRDILTIANPSNTRILHITARHNDPQMAARLANEYADVAKRYISETMETDEPKVLSEALVPLNPVSPRKMVNLVMGFLVGAILMCGYVAVQFIMDDKIKSMDDVRKATGMATLAVVPYDEGVSRKNDKRRARK